MKKIIPICLLFITLCHPQWSAAHAVITDYSLKITPIHANTPGNVELSFNSHIELGLSQIFLVSKGDK
ncbi:MAG: copper resistance protein CopC, partial [Methylobacter sp.]